jgi:H+-transporting ATPase
MLSVAGHLTIFLTRTRGPFWSIRPAKILWIAVLGTQIIATLIAVYGFLMPPLGWGWAGFVWVYALVWFLVSDRIKLLAYRIFDPAKKAGAKPETKTELQPDAESDTKTSAKSDAESEVKPEAKVVDPKPDAKAGQKPDAKAEVEVKPAVEPKPEAKAKTTADLTLQIATRAYELYEQQGRRDGQSVQNWDKAEQEIRATQTKAEPKAEIKPATKAESEPETKAQPTSDTNSKPEVKVEPALAAKVEPKPETKPELKSEATP